MSTDLTIFTDDGFKTTLKIAEALVKSGVLPKGINNPFQAFAIIQKGREIGVGPMRALTGIALIEGKTTVSPELKLEQFKGRGGHVKWIKSDNLVAHLHLKAPNGDEHEETVTIEDMKMAGVASKDNWRKYPKSMLRARAVGFGLRALGEGDGSYTPDELGAVTNEEGEAIYAPPARNDQTEYEEARRYEARESAGPKVPNGTSVATSTTSEDAALLGQLEASVLVDVIDPKTGEVTGRSPKATRNQLARAHILKNDLHYSDDVWRKRLMKRFGVDSSALLCQEDIQSIIDAMETTRRNREEKARQALNEVAEFAREDQGDEPTEQELNQS
jgi:hypothetical protein